MIRKFAVSVLGAALFASASNVLAADISMPVIPGPAPVVVPPAPERFDWGRFYVGVSLGSWREPDFDDHDGLFSRAMAVAGYNFEVGQRLVLGIEAQAGVNDFVGGGANLEWAVYGRTGFALGTRALLYAMTGIDSGPNERLGLGLGGGVELGLGSRLGLRLEMLVYHDFNNTGFVDHLLINGGLNFYLGR